MAEMVVGGALLRILQDLVGLANLLEAQLGAVVVRIAVGMEFLGEAPVSRLELQLAGTSRNSEGLVVAALGHVDRGSFGFAHQPKSPLIGDSDVWSAGEDQAATKFDNTD